MTIKESLKWNPKFKCSTSTCFTSIFRSLSKTFRNFKDAYSNIERRIKSVTDTNWFYVFFMYLLSWSVGKFSEISSDLHQVMEIALLGLIQWRNRKKKTDKTRPTYKDTEMLMEKYEKGAKNERSRKRIKMALSFDCLIKTRRRS